MTESDPVPPDLRSAINHAKLQYQAKPIKRFTDLFLAWLALPLPHKSH